MFPSQKCLLAFFLSISTFGVPYFCSSQTNQPSSGQPVVFDVRNYGATGDGKTLDSPSIDKAIEACAAAGGRIEKVNKSSRLRVELSGDLTSSLYSYVTFGPAGDSVTGDVREVDQYYQQ